VRILLAAILSVCFNGASAQSVADLAGYYAGDGLYLRVFVLDKRTHQIVANVQTGVPDCVGDFTGIGTLRDTFVKLHPHKEDLKNAPACVVELSFDATGRRVTASEGEDCWYFHGSKCRFDGEMARKRARKMPNPSHDLDAVVEKHKRKIQSNP
jgi:hypothetical protein